MSQQKSLNDFFKPFGNFKRTKVTVGAPGDISQFKDEGPKQSAMVRFPVDIDGRKFVKEWYANDN